MCLHGCESVCVEKGDGGGGGGGGVDMHVCLHVCDSVCVCVCGGGGSVINDLVMPSLMNTNFAMGFGVNGLENESMQHQEQLSMQHQEQLSMQHQE